VVGEFLLVRKATASVLSDGSRVGIGVVNVWR
jgi:hypothetical protein